MSEHLVVSLASKDYDLPFQPGLSVREMLDKARLPLRSACGGMGVCGRCQVRVVTGTGNDPTPAELKLLSPAYIEQGIRLACQLRPKAGMRLSIENPPGPNWQLLSRPGHVPRPPAFSASFPLPLGVAVDLGTTQIRLSLFDRASGRFLSGRIGLNPQAVHGSDVLTRLVKALESEERAGELNLLAKTAIAEALFELAESYNLREIGHLAIVGNPPMLALLSGKNYACLIEPDYWMRAVDCLPEETRSWTEAWGLNPEARIEVVAPLAGFVGSDLLAGVLATGLINGPAGSLFLDFGTNSELALWDGSQLWITSAAGGPAFEGCGLGCGIPAEPGAVHRVQMDAASLQFRFEVLGGGTAQGLCGSGIVDVMAGLVKAGILRRNGRFIAELGKQSYPLDESLRLFLSTRDIDVFQRAKAAIGAGLACLLAQAGLHLSDLRRVCVGGAFGRFLDVENAQALGLLPPVAAGQVELCGDTALSGCEMLLFAAAGTAALEEIRKKARVINLSFIPDFETLFIRNLYLQPIT